MSVIEKLRRSAQSERELGNVAAAAHFERKISDLERKHGGLVSVQKVNDVAAARRWVEQQWEEMDPETQVVILEIQPGLSRAIRRMTTMKEALPLLKAEKARLLGRADAEWVLPPQADTSNTPRLVPDAANKSQLYI